MAILIENYRGIDIYFEPNKELFYTQVGEDSVSRKSFAAAKKKVDEYLKANEKFEEIYCSKEDGKGGIYTVTITGIRKDGRLSTEDSDGDIGQMADYSMREWNVEDESNWDVRPKFKDLDDRRKKANAEFDLEYSELYNQLKHVKLESVIKERMKKIVW